VEFRNEKRTLPELKNLSYKLLQIWADAILYMMEKYGRAAINTEIYRSDTEQHVLCEKYGIDYYPSPHSDYRAIDIVFTNAQIKEYKSLEKYICDKYPYGKGTYKTCIYHRVGSGGFHIHLQVKPGTI
jgi:hypothetical protein